MYPDMRHHILIHPFTFLASLWLLCTACGNEQIYSLADYGLIPNQENDSSPLLRQALEKIAQEVNPD